jgi:virginiamycin B lyase
MWFTALVGPHKLGRIALNGTVREMDVPAPHTGIAGISSGPDGALWFTENDAGRVGGVTRMGHQVALVSAGSYPIGITAGHDGNMWICESQSNAIARLTLSR